MTPYGGEAPEPVSEPRGERKDEHTEEDESLPAAWVHLVNEASGRQYQFNETDNIRKRERLGVQSLDPNHDGAQKKPFLQTKMPSGWVELINEYSGKPYDFYEEVENHAQYDTPTECGEAI